VWLFKTIRKELEKVGGLKRFFSLSFAPYSSAGLALDAPQRVG
jgi:hypothetical protein